MEGQGSLQQVFVDHLPPLGATLQLGGDEGHYLGRALRARPGERFRLAAEDGRAAVGELTGFSGGEALLTVLERDDDPQEPWGLHLALCPPRGDAFDQALEAAVQLGALSVRLLRSERTLATLGQGALKADKVERRLREAARQCLRAALPELLEPLDYGAFLSLPLEGRRLHFSEHGGAPLSAVAQGAAAGSQFHLLIGPEGGFSADELKRSGAAGWPPTTLGPRPLRVPTAVAAAMAGLRALQPGA